MITPDGGRTLLSRADERLDLTRRVAACFLDHRQPGLVVHDVGTLLLQRVYGLALGHEDLNDHEALGPGTAGGRGTDDGTGIPMLPVQRGKAGCGKMQPMLSRSETSVPFPLHDSLKDIGIHPSWTSERQVLWPRPKR